MKKSTEVFVDSVNGKICRLLIGKAADEIHVPLAYLPKGSREGTKLLLTFETSCDKNKDQAEIDELLSNMPS
ncbi:MAG: hypothetical protein RR214_00335 [Synergistaceae bacterium]